MTFNRWRRSLKNGFIGIALISLLLVVGLRVQTGNDDQLRTEAAEAYSQELLEKYPTHPCSPARDSIDSLNYGRLESPNDRPDASGGLLLIFGLSTVMAGVLHVLERRI